MSPTRPSHMKLWCSAVPMLSILHPSLKVPRTPTYIWYREMATRMRPAAPTQAGPPHQCSAWEASLCCSAVWLPALPNKTSKVRAQKAM